MLADGAVRLHLRQSYDAKGHSHGMNVTGRGWVVLFTFLKARGLR
ncbi:MAG: hypothetical protein ACP5O7_05350 [Phycisphaerae bacterium]